MQKVLKIDNENSKILVSGEDGKSMEEYNLSSCTFTPQVGDFVNIYKSADNVIIEKNTATESVITNSPVNNVTTTEGGKQVNKIVYILITLFLGGLGIHKFISGKIGIGFAYIAITVFGALLFFLGPLVVGILCIIDIVKVAGLPADPSGNVTVKSTGFFEA
jgi:TM2 domain-containing membrane protein YozV